MAVRTRAFFNKSLKLIDGRFQEAYLVNLKKNDNFQKVETRLLIRKFVPQPGQILESPSVTNGICFLFFMQFGHAKNLGINLQ
jgi:hypothetical protein